MSILNEFLVSVEIGLIYSLAALGIYLTFRILDFPDLTCDSSFVLGGAVFSVFFNAFASNIAALICAFLCAFVAGVCTGMIHIKLKVTNLLSGILVAFMLYSINLRIMQGPNLITDSTFLDQCTIYILCGILTFLFLPLVYMFYTHFGLGIRAVGTNKVLSKNSGISISFMTLFTLGLSNAFIGLSGALFVIHQGSCDIQVGIGTVIRGLASVMIGEIIIPSQMILMRFLACIVGSIGYCMLTALALKTEFFALDSKDFNLISGVLILIIIFIKRKKNVRS